MLWIIKDKQFKSLLTGGGKSFLIKGGGSVLGIIVLSILTNELGSIQSGYYFTVFSLFTVGLTIGTMGLTNTVLKLVSVNYSKSDYSVANKAVYKSIILSSILCTSLSISIFIGSSLISIVIFEDIVYQNILILFSIALPFWAVSQIIGYAIQGLNRVSLSFALTGPALNLILLLLFFYDNPKSAEMASSYFIISNVIVCCLSIYYWAKLRKVGGQGRVSYKKIISSSMPIAISKVFFQISNNAAILYLAFWFTPSDVAFFAVCTRVAGIIGLVIDAMNRFISPQIAVMFAKGKVEELESLVSKTISILILITLPIFIITLIIPNYILSIFGNDFEGAAAVLIVVILGQVLNSFFGPVANILVMTGNEKYYRNANMISSTLAILIGILLVSNLGSIGAAIMYSSTLFITNYYCWYCVREKVGLKFSLMKF
ncbi:MATE family efflux transporter [Thalassotalea nanhaiensis]|uniref:MATE family efflux transporter n=1 Tax=Thalassotalea nanhaiensis TaxID=3065648 RepID=A0ABY9TLD6_9GAMM|nr:MATE family efflux transporter [Colwelliaceae bacterium SQ345]